MSQNHEIEKLKRPKLQLNQNTKELFKIELQLNERYFRNDNIK